MKKGDNGLFPIEIAHGKGHATEGVCLDGFAGYRYAVLHLLLIFRTESAKYKVNLPTAWEIVAYSKLQAVVGLCAEHLCNVVKPIVPAVRTALPHADGANGQAEVIDDNEQFFQSYLFLLHPISHGVSAEVHVSGWLQENELLVFHSHVGNETISFVLERNIGRLSEGVQYSESYIVAGSVVLRSDVSQPYNQVFHRTVAFCLCS